MTWSELPNVGVSALWKFNWPLLPVFQFTHCFPAVVSPTAGNHVSPAVDSMLPIWELEAKHVFPVFCPDAPVTETSKAPRTKKCITLYHVLLFLLVKPRPSKMRVVGEILAATDFGTLPVSTANVINWFASSSKNLRGIPIFVPNAVFSKTLRLWSFTSGASLRLQRYTEYVPYATYGALGGCLEGSPLSCAMMVKVWAGFCSKFKTYPNSLACLPLSIFNTNP